MPELDGLETARLLQSGAAHGGVRPAYDEFAVQAFELNAVDYLLKPVEHDCLATTLDRARQRDASGDQPQRLTTASAALEAATRRQFLERIPVRKRDEVVILQVRQIASIVAEGELLHLTTLANERYTISHRLHALASRLDPRRFVRLGRGTLAAVDQIQRVSPMPGGTFQVDPDEWPDLAGEPAAIARAARDAAPHLKQPAREIHRSSNVRQSMTATICGSGPTFRRKR